MKIILGIRIFYRHNLNSKVTTNMYPLVSTKENHVHGEMCLAWVDYATLESLGIGGQYANRSWELYNFGKKLL